MGIELDVDNSAGLIDSGTVQQIRWLSCFGRLIGNTDMHSGNLSFYLSGGRVQGLAPTYDMLPMRYVPRHHQLVDAPLELPVPTPGSADVWPSACAAAQDFWGRVATHDLIDPSVQALARANLQRLTELASIASHLPRVDAG